MGLSIMKLNQIGKISHFYMFSLTVIWCVALGLITAQWTSGYGPTHCDARATVPREEVSPYLVVPMLLPLVIAIFVHVRTLMKPAVPQPAVPTAAACQQNALSSAPSTSSKKSDLALVAANLAIGVVTGGFWAGGIAHDLWGNSERRINWLPSIAASLCGFLYAVHRPFRDTYYRLFNYCCCKTTVNMSRRGRTEPRMELYQSTSARTTTENIRVHIIPPYNMYNSQTSPRVQQVQAKPRQHKDNRRKKPLGRKEIYQL